ncbi:hypothetical protein D3C72_2051720 [compost metagenome]
MGIGTPSAPTNAVFARLAVPSDTTSRMALATARATSGDNTCSASTLLPRLTMVSYGVLAAKCMESMRTLGLRTPSLMMMPINSASAAGRSADAPRVVAYDGTSESNG